MSLRTGREALTWARGQNENPWYNWTNLCLKFTRMCFNVASRYPSAEVAWYNTKKRHTSWPPPAGVPVWWTNGRYGHVVISAGNGYCWSTDFKRRGQVDLVKIQDITNGWGQRYRGWTEDINGVTVWTAPPKELTLDLSDVVYAAKRSKRVRGGRALKRAVAREVGRGFMNTRTNTLGRAFRRQYKKVQKKYLNAVGGTVNRHTADGIPGLGSLSWLGRRRGFRVKK